MRAPPLLSARRKTNGFHIDFVYSLPGVEGLLLYCDVAVSIEWSNFERNSNVSSTDAPLFSRWLLTGVCFDDDISGDAGVGGGGERIGLFSRGCCCCDCWEGGEEQRCVFRYFARLFLNHTYWFEKNDKVVLKDRYQFLTLRYLEDSLYSHTILLLLPLL